MSAALSRKENRVLGQDLNRNSIVLVRMALTPGASNAKTSTAKR
jgi:hypothetical protein